MNKIKTRQYSSYDEYVAHQKSKADHGTLLHKQLLNELWEPDCQGFRENFKPYEKIIKESKSGLCLGARTGQEVFVLREMGLEAIGIDLVENLPLVLKGDVHNLNYPDKSFDFIFSNIFDHILYPDKFINEIKRVLVPKGYCLLHLSIASNGHPDGDPWSSCEVNSSKQVIELFGDSYTVIDDMLLGQKNWPTYWTLMVKKNDT
jgi:SAM-dependent methyltransferase